MDNIQAGGEQCVPIVGRLSTLQSIHQSFSCVLQYGAVPLEVAAENGHTHTVQRLLEAGANVNHHVKVVKALH